MIPVAQIGAGLMGRERLEALRLLRSRGRDVQAVGLFDPYNPDAPSVAAQAGIPLFSSLDELMRLDPDWAFLATPHDTAVELLAPLLLRPNTRVLVEKPLGRSLAETHSLVARASAVDQLWVGLNYRFFDGVAALLQDARSGRFGNIVSARLLMGHGGSSGMEQTWKLDPYRAGGGALLDPGIHLLDLARLLAGGNLSVIGGASWNGFWNTGVEEECHVLLRGRDISIINLEVSVVRWRSTFSLEVHGDCGYGRVEGRGRTYGQQTYRRGKRWGWMSGQSQADSEEHVLSTTGQDVFQKEVSALFFPHETSQTEACSASQALQTMELLDDCRRALGLPSLIGPGIYDG